eukprot:TRINITY_DN1261_c0_g2_i10.p2 TRINITY_DN1261_c0_g2~~TRINITY_DN1261_c0_g2_i10.p2  ORF type:complete len:275 (-),score=-56.23 TRINITY_DN1261_c0_g2_i10:351-1175(-)
MHSLEIPALNVFLIQTHTHKNHISCGYADVYFQIYFYKLYYQIIAQPPKLPSYSQQLYQLNMNLSKMFSRPKITPTRQLNITCCGLLDTTNSKLQGAAGDCLIVAQANAVLITFSSNIDHYTCGQHVKQVCMRNLYFGTALTAHCVPANASLPVFQKQCAPYAGNQIGQHQIHQLQKQRKYVEDASQYQHYKQIIMQHRDRIYIVSSLVRVGYKLHARQNRTYKYQSPRVSKEKVCVPISQKNQYFFKQQACCGVTKLHQRYINIQSGVVVTKV